MKTRRDPLREKKKGKRDDSEDRRVCPGERVVTKRCKKAMDNGGATLICNVVVRTYRKWIRKKILFGSNDGNFNYTVYTEYQSCTAYCAN